MAFKLKPSKEEKLNFPGLTNMQILLLALKATEPLKWNIEDVTLHGAKINVPISMQSHGEEITLTLDEGNNNGEIAVRSQSLSIQFIDYGKNRKNIRKLQEKIEELKASIEPEELEQMARNLEEDIVRPLTEEEEAILQEQKKQESFFYFFIPRKDFLATPILIDINILVFILMVVNGVGILEPSTWALLKWGANFGPLTLTGDWWRAITCNFLHIGGFHLLMNMYAFIFIGLWLEHLIGARRMFVSYLLTGLCAAIFSLSMHGETISAGASGSIFGLYGVFLAYLIFHGIEKSQRKPLLTSIAIFIGYNLLLGMKDGIDNAAHLGGLFSGFLLGLIYVGSSKLGKPELEQIVTTIGELCIFAAVLFTFIAQCKDIPTSYHEMRKEWEMLKPLSAEEIEKEIERGKQESEPQPVYDNRLEEENSPVQFQDLTK